MLFKDLNIIEPILRSIEEAGYEKPTAIQEKSIPAILNGRDILGCAQTGTGKTAAFAIPILQSIIEEKKTNNDRNLKALIVAPTRELAIQIGENVTTLDASGDQSLFLSGQSPIHLDGSWFMTQINDSDNPEAFGFMSFPYFAEYSEYKNNWHSGSSEGFSLAATNGEERLQASIKLLKYLTDEEAYNESQALSKGGIYPVTTMKEIDDITPIAKEFQAAFTDVNEAKLEPGDYAAKAQLREEIRDAIQGMFAGTSVDDTLARIQKVTDME